MSSHLYSSIQGLNIFYNNAFFSFLILGTALLYTNEKVCFERTPLFKAPLLLFLKKHLPDA